jgi:hypothetical protein
MSAKEDDYTRYRTVDPQNPPYTIDDPIGRRDKVDTMATTSMVVTTGYSLVPTIPLGRRNFLRITNSGVADVYLTTSTGIDTLDGYPVGAGETFEENTDAKFYVSTAVGTSTVNVYERATCE